MSIKMSIVKLDSCPPFKLLLELGKTYFEYDSYWHDSNEKRLKKINKVLKRVKRDKILMSFPEIQKIIEICETKLIDQDEFNELILKSRDALKKILGDEIWEWSFRMDTIMKGIGT